MENSLLLSAGYEPLKIISWKRAITLVFLQKVEVLEEYETEIHSPSISIPLPAVVKLRRYIKPIPRKVKFSRQNIFSRDNFTCQYCHKEYPIPQLTYDHIIPRSLGGSTSWTNVVTSCQRCNLNKGNKPLNVINYKLLKKPEEPRWLPHLSQLLYQNPTPSSWRDYLAFQHK